MRRCVWLGVLVLCGVVAVAQAQQAGLVVNAPGAATYWSGANPGQGAKDVTVERLRALRLSDEQIQKFQVLRRDVEKERVALEARVKAAQQAAAAANAETARLQGELQTLLTQRIVKVLDSLMNEDQRKAWHQQDFTEQAKQWLQGYKGWLKLTDAQVDDISGMLVPVFEKYSTMEGDLVAARKNLSDLHLADAPDVAAIDAAEKKVSELSTQGIAAKRQAELMDKMAAGLLPDQLERFDKTFRRH